MSVKSNLEFNAVIRSNHEAKYKLILDCIRNKFGTFSYLQQFVIHPDLDSTAVADLFLLGMAGYCKLEVRNELSVYVFIEIRGRDT